jgi:FAD:protein FMN transferase
MACRFEILLPPSAGSDAADAAVAGLDTITYLEQVWSVYIANSELTRLNAGATKDWVPVSESTYTLLKLGLEIFDHTGGTFDMTAAKLSKIWGFHQRQGKMPMDSEIEQALQSVGMQWIEWDDEGRRIHFAKPLEVNPGGIGKGYAIDCASESLKRHASSFAFHGGKSSVLCHGNQSLGESQNSVEGGGWKIAVRHPEQSERILGTLTLYDQSLGTSGPANQFFYFRGKRYGHIIDPRTGWPADGMLSVTVLHRSAGWADALATGLYVMGPERAIAYCEQNPHVSMLAILPTERTGTCEVITCNMRPDQWNPI